MIIQQELQVGSVTGFVYDYLLHFSQATLSLRALSASLPYDQMAMLHTLSLLCFPLILLIQQIFSLIVYLFFFFLFRGKQIDRWGESVRSCQRATWMGASCIRHEVIDFRYRSLKTASESAASSLSPCVKQLPFLPTNCSFICTAILIFPAFVPRKILSEQELLKLMPLLWLGGCRQAAGPVRNTWSQVWTVFPMLSELWMPREAGPGFYRVSKREIIIHRREELFSWTLTGTDQALKLQFPQEQQEPWCSRCQASWPLVALEAFLKPLNSRLFQMPRLAQCLGQMNL